MPAPGARAAARKLGLKTYFTGVPCLRGHVAERAVSSIACLECRKEKRQAEFQKWYSRPENQQRVVAQAKGWKKANPKKVLAHTRHRQARLKKRTPLWANRAMIQKIYEECPVGYHVDHVIPLHGKQVSGLHVETNLQYLPARENAVKGNRHGQSDLPATS